MRKIYRNYSKNRKHEFLGRFRRVRISDEVDVNIYYSVYYFATLVF